MVFSYVSHRVAFPICLLRTQIALRRDFEECRAKKPHNNNGSNYAYMTKVWALEHVGVASAFEGNPHNPLTVYLN